MLLDQATINGLNLRYYTTTNYTVPEDQRIRVDIMELRRLAAIAKEHPSLQMADALNCSARFDPAVFDDPEFITLLDCILANEGDFGLSFTHAFDWLIETHHNAPAIHPVRDQLAKKTQEFLKSEKLKDSREVKQHPVFIYYTAWVADHLPAGTEKDSAVQFRDDMILACTQGHAKTAAQIMFRAGQNLAEFLLPETVTLFAEKVRSIVQDHERQAAPPQTLRGKLAAACASAFRSDDRHDLLDDDERQEMSEWVTGILETGLPPRPQAGRPHAPEDGL